MIMWINIVASYSLLVIRNLRITNNGQRTTIERHGISDTTGLTPFVVVVGSNNFLPVSVCLLTRSESCKSSLDFLLR